MPLCLPRLMPMLLPHHLRARSSCTRRCYFRRHPWLRRPNQATPHHAHCKQQRHSLSAPSFYRRCCHKPTEPTLPEEPEEPRRETCRKGKERSHQYSPPIHRLPKLPSQAYRVRHCGGQALSSQHFATLVPAFGATLAPNKNVPGESLRGLRAFCWLGSVECA